MTESVAESLRMTCEGGLLKNVQRSLYNSVVRSWVIVVELRRQIDSDRHAHWKDFLRVKMLLVLDLSRGFF